MSFQPIIPATGLAGWSLLKSTMAAQRASFDRSPVIQRDSDYFEATIAEVRSAEALVADRRLLTVALGAFGLSDDINSRAFIRKILEDGSEASDALANRLTDSRYREFARTFGFGNILGARTGDPGFGARIAELFRTREFEVAVGNQDESMRLALNAERSLPDIVTTGTEETKWLRVMGDPPLRKFFETALGLPPGFGQIDLDQQIEEFSDRAKRQLRIESLSELSDPAVMKRSVERFLLRDQIADFSVQTPGSAALTLLQSVPSLRG